MAAVAQAPYSHEERLRGLPLPRLLASLANWRVVLSHAVTPYQRKRAMEEIDAIKRELMRRQAPIEVQ